MKIIFFVISSMIAASSNMMPQLTCPINTKYNKVVYEETDTANTSNKGSQKPKAPKPHFPPILIPPIINHK